MGNQDHRQRDERHRFMADPEVTRLAETMPAPGSGQSAEFMKEIKTKAKSALNKRSRDKHNQRMIKVEANLPGMAPSPFDPRGVSPKERHAQTNRAIERAQAAVDLVFDFTENLIRTGNDIVTKVHQGKEVSEAETRIVGEARQAANKLLDKTVPDIITDGKSGGMVQINFGAPLARLMQTGPQTIELPVNTEEETNGTTDDQLPTK